MTAFSAPASLIRDLRRVVSNGRVLEGAEKRPYRTDATASRGIAGDPDAVVLPADAKEVDALIAWAIKAGVSLVPRGGGTGLAGGAVPVDGGVVVGLMSLNSILSLEPEAWRMTVGAGVTTATVQRLARENGLLFPPDPGAAEQSQIGGNVATNAGGPHAFKYGATGAWVTGLEAAMAPGERVALGGESRKDVGGYDLKSLLVGSEGTLGIITQATLRLIPAPEVVLPLVSFFADASTGSHAAATVIASGIEPAAMDFLDGPTLALVRAAYPGTVPDDAGFVLLCEVDGARSEAMRQLNELSACLAESALLIEHPAPVALWRWRDGVSGTVAGARGGKASEDIFVPLARLAEALRRVEKIGLQVGLPACAWGHAGDGNIHASFLLDPSSAFETDLANEATKLLFGLAVELGGGITGEHGIGVVKNGQLSRQWSPQAVALHEHIKTCLDPSGVLNPGKKLAR